MKLQTFLLSASVVLAMDMGTATRPGHGLIGYGITVYQPPCAFACRDAISGATLNCSTIMEMPEMDGMDMGEEMAMTDPDCYATDDVFLQTLAYCVHSQCKDIPIWQIEKFWIANVAGTLVVQPDPKETYQEALAKVEGTPSAVYNETGTLNETSVVSQELWFAAYNTDATFAHQESMQERYALVLLLSGVVIPIAFSLLRFVPFPGALQSKFNAWFIDPPMFGTKHAALARLGLDSALTRGQAFFISYLIFINVVLSAVAYEYANPNTFYPDDRWGWMVMLVSNRLGLLSFANLPLVFLYAGRNNFLLWLTNWSHSTFILLHRWIAGISTLQAILHSLVYLHKYVKDGTHAEESKLPYWYWGIIGTLGMAILFPTSISPIRKKAYELFLVWHIVISILVVAGCYWHIIFEFQHSWGYELWIILTMVVWAFDRVARWLRLASNGVQTAEVTIVDDEYVRVTIRNVSTSGYAYLYFPTLTWRFWENHPFSVASTILPQVMQEPTNHASISSHDIEKHPGITSVPLDGRTYSQSSQNSPYSSSLKQPVQTGVTFYIRDKTGITSALRKRTSLPVLLEAGYSSHSLSSLNTSPTLIALVGGVGITAVLPYLRAHPGRVKLYWGCRTQALVDNVRASGALSAVEQEIFVGTRMNVVGILESELAGAGGSEVAVLISGPEEMTNDVRNTVSRIVRTSKGVKAKLYVESFSW
ncbi:ferric reductase-like protein transmembrane component 4 [Clathrospora elynae]|uniref:Ferric reductase-like protein transmembrane component 4 n=1 Tax=Clathrospora elynae TaxID=706981 RepID=A0A6A5SLJ3_9PLEO|nr:ferric reductase-like protein transmembrane component 4 [Clathrospora elynae]